jgi:hypothetical protein
MKDNGLSPEHLPLLWPPAWEQAARAEGWTLHIAGGTMIEVDLWPPRSSNDPIYHHLIGWLVLNVGLGSQMHLTAWTFEFLANESIYRDGRVPGDGMHLVSDEDGGVCWVSDDDTLPPFESSVRYSG